MRPNPLVDRHRAFDKYRWSRLQPAIPGRQAEACSTNTYQIVYDRPLGVTQFASEDPVVAGWEACYHHEKRLNCVSPKLNK